VASLPPLRLVRAWFPDPPTLDTAVSHAILRQVSSGERPATLRLHRPGDVVAFGPLDRHAEGYRRAVAAAEERGFGAIQRLAGGRAAVFHGGTVAFSWAIPDPSPRLGIGRRFDELAAIVAAAFRDLGIDARVGEVPGEYCPGAHSVSAGGRTKLMGVGQRVIRGAAHVGGVVVVSGGDRVRDVLVPVYRELDLPWDPATVGSLEDEIPGVTWERAEAAILARFAERYQLVPDDVDAGLVELAERLQAEHLAAVPAAGG
jgi:octanoyl-[GcvH]:protein N-octanoyltransferase